jgi:phenylpyruvate tautomerase PptA (4-oxalocrotonate tautomerase family)
MKKILIHKITLLLKSLGADESTIELVVNNVSQYNRIVTEIAKGENHNQYLAYQLNVAITKQIDMIKRLNKKINGDTQDDLFTQVVKGIKDKKAKAQEQAINKTEDLETR